MTRRTAGDWPPPWRPYVVAIGLIVALLAVCVYAFRGLPFSTGHRVAVVLDSSKGLRSGSPVRVAGANVGKVVEIGKGPGHTTIVTLELSDRGLPVHRDATVRIRPRVFLEGGYLVELSPGSPSAPVLEDGGTLPLSQTAAPVQFHDLLKTFDLSTREHLEAGLDTFSTALADGGAPGLRRLATELEPLLRETAWVAEASRGERPDDVSRLVAATDAVTTALAQDPARLESFVSNLATVADALRSRDRELAATVAGLDDLMRAAPPALRTLDAALPVVEGAAAQIDPALDVAPRAFAQTAGVLRDLGRLVAPGRREKTLAGLETAFVDLPGLVSRIAGVFPATKPVTDCLTSHVLPVLNAEVPDGELSSGYAMYLDFMHALVGLSSASSSFDGNGHSLRYQFATGDQSFSTAVLPVLGQVIANRPTAMRSRPAPRADRELPPFRPDAKCAEQPPVSLEAEDAPVSYRATRARPGRPLSPKAYRRLLQPDRLSRLLEEAR